MTSSITIGTKTIGSDSPCYIIAEAGVNHNGDLDVALQLINAACEAGADAVKFQSFHAVDLATEEAPKAAYQKSESGDLESQVDMLRKLELSLEEHQQLKAHCEACGIDYLSTPFDYRSVEELLSMSVAAFKISSGDLTNLPFLSALAQKGLPLLLSTGMATLEETSAAVDKIRQHGNPPLGVLHCVSCYPTLPEEVNLAAITTLQKELALPIGFSDHTLGTVIAPAAVALGACIIEKHLTLDNAMHGPDHAASLEPAPFKEMVEAIRTVETARGNGNKTPCSRELETATVARKSLVTATTLTQGQVLSHTHLAIKRPGTGLSPALLETVIGRTLKVDLPTGTLLKEEHLS